METTPDREGLLVTAAKAVGHVAGSVVSQVGTLVGGKSHADAPAKASHDGKLPPKHKHRLPRRLKKAMKSKESQGVV